MVDFLDYLCEFKVDPIVVFKVSDENSEKVVQKDKILGTIKMLAPKIDLKKVKKYIDIIDQNKNNQIEELEYFTFLSVDEKH